MSDVTVPSSVSMDTPVQPVIDPRLNGNQVEITSGGHQHYTSNILGHESKGYVHPTGTSRTYNSNGGIDTVVTGDHTLTCLDINTVNCKAGTIEFYGEGATDIVEIDGKEVEKVRVARDVNVNGSEHLYTMGDRSQTIDGNYTLTVNGLFMINAKQNMQVNIGSDMVVKIEGMSTQEIGKGATVTVVSGGRTTTIHGGDKLTCPFGSLSMNATFHATLHAGFNCKLSSSAFTQMSAGVSCEMASPVNVIGGTASMLYVKSIMSEFTGAVSIKMGLEVTGPSLLLSTLSVAGVSTLVNPLSTVGGIMVSKHTHGADCGTTFTPNPG